MTVTERATGSNDVTAPFGEAPAAVGGPRPTREWRAVREYQDVEIALSTLSDSGEFSIYPEALGSDTFAIRIKNGRLVLQARGLVGWVAVNHRLGLDIAPRVPIADLDAFLTRAGALPAAFAPLVRRYGTLPHHRPSLRDALAEALLTAVDAIASGGVYRRYERRMESTSFPRGRVMDFESARHHWGRGQRHRVIASWFAHDRDVGPNQVIRRALLQLADTYANAVRTKGRLQLLQRLNRAYQLFDGVSPSASALQDPEVVDPGRIPESRAYYRPAVELARTIVRGSTIRVAGPGDEVTMPSLLFKMDDAFEEYCRRVLQRRLTSVEAVRVLDGILAPPTGGQRPLFDGPEEPGASPDVVILPIDGGGLDPARLVIEVKYFDRDFGREEYEQAIAYAATFRCPALLVRPKTAREGRSGVTSIGSIGNIRLFSFAFDLAAADLDVEEARFTSEVRGLMNRFRSRGRASGGRYDSFAEPIWQATLGL